LILRFPDWKATSLVLVLVALTSLGAACAFPQAPQPVEGQPVLPPTPLEATPSQSPTPFQLRPTFTPEPTPTTVPTTAPTATPRATATAAASPSPIASGDPTGRGLKVRYQSALGAVR